MGNRSLYKEPITIHPNVGQNSIGPVYDTPIDLLCHSAQGNHRIFSATGVEVTATLQTDFPWQDEGKFHVGDKAIFGGIEYVAIRVSPVKVNGRTDHVEADFGPFGESG